MSSLTVDQETKRADRGDHRADKGSFRDGYALPETVGIIAGFTAGEPLFSASSRSSSPRPRPSRSHSPPTSSTIWLAVSRSITLPAWTLPALELAAYCACGRPMTLGKCGGSFARTDDSGTVVAGVDDNKSMYEMKESRFVDACGEGGCEMSGAGIVIVVGCGGADAGEVGNEWSGCSWWVAVVGDDASEPTSEGTADAVAE